MFNKEVYRLSDTKVPEARCKVKVGERYGQLTVIESPVYLIRINAKTNTRIQFVLSQCDCGETTFRECFELKNGRVSACYTCNRTNQLDKIRKGTLAKNGIKQCSKCLNYLPIDKFYVSTKKTDGYQSACTMCESFTVMKKTYKLNDNELNYLIRPDNLYCKICGIIVSMEQVRKTIRSATIDHNHKTNKVRDILCRNCNTGLGIFSDNPETLEKAAAYLRKHASDS